MMRNWLVGVLVLGGMTMSAGAQAPAGAPAGANGICKDGTYSTATKKDGACRGHKGVQTWYVAAAPVNAAPAAVPAKTAPAAMPAPTAQTSAPVAAPAPAAASSSKKVSPAAAAAAKPQAAGGGPGLVWVNTESKVYHCNGDAFYGKTKAGSYMTEDAAKAAGAHGVRGQSCAGK